MNVPTKHIALYGLLGACITGILIVYVPGDIAGMHKEIRGYLFSGLLTLGSFLLSTKTFVVTRLQEGLFQLPEYKQTWDIYIEQNPKKKGEPRNQPLRELTEYISLSIFACLSMAVLQLVLSFFQNRFASAFALALSAGALFLVLNAWARIRDLIGRYLNEAEKVPVKDR